MDKEVYKISRIKQEILNLFPEKIRTWFDNVLREAEIMQEIRLRSNKPVIIRKKGQDYYLTLKGTLRGPFFGNITRQMEPPCILTMSDIESIFLHICRDSVFAYTDELKNGFITVQGGHRVGVTGHAVMLPKNDISTLRNISALNIRISHEIKGIGEEVLSRIMRGGYFDNTIIVSPPGAGKTTLLRDMIRILSEGAAYGGYHVGIVDERSEIAGTYMGECQNDLGIRSDVLDGCPKVTGINMLIRSMAPQIIAVDELGSLEESKAIIRACYCGCKILATIHGFSVHEVMEQSFMEPLIKDKMIRYYIVLSNKKGVGTIEGIYDKEGMLC